MPTVNKYIVILFRILIAIVIFYKLYNYIDWAAITSTLIKTNSLLLITGGFFFCLKTMNDSYRWYLLADAYNIQAPYLNLLRYNFESTAFDFVTPLPQAEEFYRFGRLAYYTDKTTAAMVVVGIKFTGSLALLSTLPIAIYYTPAVRERIGQGNGRIFILILLFVLPVGFWIWQQQRFRLPVFMMQYINRIKQLVQVIRRKQLTLPTSYILAILSQVLYAFCIFFLSKSIVSSVTLLNSFCIIPLLFLTSLVPIGIGGLGIKEAAIIWMLQHLGVPLHLALSIALLHFLLMTLYIGVGGILLLKDIISTKSYAEVEK